MTRQQACRFIRSRISPKRLAGTLSSDLAFHAWWVELVLKGYVTPLPYPGVALRRRNGGNMGVQGRFMLE